MRKKEYIEREAALTMLYWYEDWGCPATPEALKAVEEIRVHVRKLPAADVAPVVHGEWLYVDGRGRNAEYECSVCHDHVQFDEKIDGSIPRYKGCPHCLAKMKEVIR